MQLKLLIHNSIRLDRSISTNLCLLIGSANHIEEIYHGFIGALIAIAIVYSAHYSITGLKNKKTVDMPPQEAAPGEKEPDTPSRAAPMKKIENPLWLKIDKAMNEQELWRDPDLTVSMMIDKMNTNRTSFSNAIRDGGFNNFNNYLAHYRIQAFCKQVESEEIDNIQDAFFKVGYKARTTAFNQFKKTTGMSPTKYIERYNPYRESGTNKTKTEHVLNNT